MYTEPTYNYNKLLIKKINKIFLKIFFIFEDCSNIFLYKYVSSNTAGKSKQLKEIFRASLLSKISDLVNC